MSNKPHTAEQYAADVRAGKVVVCKYVRLAVEQYYADLENALDKGWHFDPRRRSGPSGLSRA